VWHVGCGFERDVHGILLEGLPSLEYRGYDSAGIMGRGLTPQHRCIRAREVGKVALLWLKPLLPIRPAGSVRHRPYTLGHPMVRPRR